MQTFFRDILYYSGGSIIGRVVTLFLLPLTTFYLTPQDYGIIAILILIPSFTNGLFCLGFHTSLGRIYSDSQGQKSKEGIIWSAFLILCINNFFWLLLTFILLEPLSWLLLGDSSQSYLIWIAFLGASISSVRMSFDYYLRAMGESLKCFCFNMADVSASIGFMLWMTVVLKRGAAGYIEGFLLAQSFNLILRLALVMPKLSLSWQPQAVKEMVKLGLPCIYGYWGYCTLLGASRFSLQWFYGDAEAGIFFMGSNIGRIIELPLWGFMSAWVPLFNSYLHKQSEAPHFFSKVMTYYLLAMSLFCSALFCFARPVIHAFVQPAFYGTWHVIGLSAIAHSLWGAYSITTPPLVFFKKTRLQSYLEIGAGIICLIANFFLIPFFNIFGAAFATLLGFLSLLCLSLRINQQLLFVPYDTKRIRKIIFSLLAVAIITFIPIEKSQWYILMTSSILLVHLIYCWFIILTVTERNEFKAILTSLISPKISDPVGE